MRTKIWRKKNLLSDLENQLVPGSEYYQMSVDAYNILQSNFYKAPQSIPEDSIRELFYNMVIPWKLAFNTVTFDNLSAIGMVLRRGHLREYFLEVKPLVEKFVNNSFLKRSTPFTYFMLAGK